MNYPKSYHAALNGLIHYGSRRAELRPVIAAALCDIRQRFGGAAARHERRHMLYVVGAFPDKEPRP